MLHYCFVVLSIIICNKSVVMTDIDGEYIIGGFFFYYPHISKKSNEKVVCIYLSRNHQNEIPN